MGRQSIITVRTIYKLNSLSGLSPRLRDGVTGCDGR